MTATVEEMHAWLVRQIGTVEHPAGSNCQPYSRDLGWPCEAWCAVEQVDGAKQVGLALPAGAKTASAPAMFDAFRKAGKYGHAPRYGAFAFFHFPGATSGIDHVGWVESWTAGTITSIDGNTASSGGQYNGGACLRRSRDRSLVVVYGYPDYAPSTAPAPPGDAIVSNAPPVAILVHPAWPHGAYAQVCADGGVFDFGGAPYYGSEGSTHLNAPIVDAAVTPSGKGYWLVASDGGVFTHGDAQFEGSTGAIHLNKPIIRIAPTATGQGYLLTAADGGLFAFGDAEYHGHVSYPA